MTVTLRDARFVHGTIPSTIERQTCPREADDLSIDLFADDTISVLTARTIYVLSKTQFACNHWSSRKHAVRPGRKQAPQRDEFPRA